MKLVTKYLVNTSEKAIIDQYQEQFAVVFSGLANKTAVGAKDWTGWIDWVNRDHEIEIQRMERIRDQWLERGVQTVVVIGIGGSYIGVRAGIEYNNGLFGNDQKLKILFLSSFSSYYIDELIKKLGNDKFALVVISKSGTTLEVAVGFRLLRTLLYQKFPEEADHLIVTVTDPEKGVLKQLTDNKKYPTFRIEPDIGGRYSTLTAVGLFPSVLAGIDVRQYLAGAQKAYRDCYHGDLKTNQAGLYAAFRHYFYVNYGKKIECLCSYDPQLNFLIEQAKQLFGESEGKEGKGLMPLLMNYTTDLHSLGQLVQAGDKSFFETVFLVNQPKANIKIERSIFDNDDQLDWLLGNDLAKINECAFYGTVEAHSFEGKVDNLVWQLPDWTAFSFGYAYYLLCFSTVFSAYLLGVNPFDQPGVENYKKRMFSLLKNK